MVEIVCMTWLLVVKYSALSFYSQVVLVVPSKNLGIESPLRGSPSKDPMNGLDAKDGNTDKRRSYKSRHWLQK